jgi:hypothetical protein
VRERGWGRGRFQSQANRLKYRLRLQQNIMIPKMQYAKALCAQPSVSRRINLRIVLTAIDLNHQAMGQANKINDVTSDWY